MFIFFSLDFLFDFSFFVVDFGFLLLISFGFFFISEFLIGSLLMILLLLVGASFVIFVLLLNFGKQFTFIMLFSSVFELPSVIFTFPIFLLFIDKNIVIC